MSQIITYKNRDKRVSIKLGNPITESHGLDLDEKSHPRLLMLAEWLGKYSRIFVDLHAGSKAQY
jgi:hypothetical protein